MAKVNGSNISYDIKELYKKAFGGSVAPPFPVGGFPDPINKLPINPKNFDLSLLGVGKNSKSMRLMGTKDKNSMLGAEIHMPLQLGIPGEKKYTLPNEPIVSIYGSNEIVSTTINRGKRRGTVKEIININDYRINIKGIIINEKENDFPDDIMRNMRTILENPGVIEIASHITTLFDIQYAVVYDFRFPRTEETKLRWCSYEIDLISDQDFEIDLTL